MKKETVGAPVLAYYNPKKQPTLQTDASVKGLGVCLLQDQYILQAKLSLMPRKVMCQLH